MNLIFWLKAHLSWVFCLLQTQYGHTLQIPGQADEVPFALGSSQAAHRELTKAHDRLDDAEYRFDGLFAQGIEFSTGNRLQAMGHPLYRRGAIGQGWCKGGGWVNRAMGSG